MRIVVFMLVYFFSACLSQAEVVVLKSGQSVEGKVIQKTDDEVVMDVNGVSVTFWSDEIASVQADQPHNEVAVPKVITQRSFDEILDGIVSGDFESVQDSLSQQTFSDVDESQEIKKLMALLEALKQGAVKSESVISYAKGVKYLKGEKNDLAISEFQKYIELNPEDKEAMNNLSVAYFGAGDFNKAKSTLEKVLEIDPNFIEGIFNLGVLSRDNPAQAIELFNKILELDPKYFRAYRALGLAYKHQGQYEKALDHYLKYYEFDPAAEKKYLLLNDIGRCLTRLSKFEEAIEYFQKSIEDNPDYVTSYVDLAYGYRLLEEYDQSVGVFKLALKKDPNNTQAYKGLGDSYRFLKRYDEALEAYKKALKMDPMDVDLAIETSGGLASMQRFDEAIEVLKRSSHAVPRSADLYVAMGTIYLHSGKAEEGKEVLQQALAIYESAGDKKKQKVVEDLLRN